MKNRRITSEKTWHLSKLNVSPKDWTYTQELIMFGSECQLLARGVNAKVDFNVLCVKEEFGIIEPFAYWIYKYNENWGLKCVS